MPGNRCHRTEAQSGGGLHSPSDSLDYKSQSRAAQVLSTERQHPRNRKSKDLRFVSCPSTSSFSYAGAKDGNVREELGVPPKTE